MWRAIQSAPPWGVRMEPTNISTHGRTAWRAQTKSILTLPHTDTSRFFHECTVRRAESRDISREGRRSTQRRGHGTRRIPTCAVCDARTDEVGGNGAAAAASRGRYGDQEEGSEGAASAGWSTPAVYTAPRRSLRPRRSSSSTMTESPAAGLRRPHRQAPEGGGCSARGMG